MKHRETITIAAVQFQHKAEDKEYNLGVIRDFVWQAAEKGAELVCFPEMCVSGYWHLRHHSENEIRALAEVVPTGESSQTIVQLAKSSGIVISVGLIELGEDGRLYNTQIVAEPNGDVHRHRKLHCFVNEHMSSGDGYTVFNSSLGVRIGVLTCWDNNLIENVRATALLGAEVILAPHQTGGCDSRSPRAMGRIDPRLWHNREAEPERLKEEFQGSKGRSWLMRWLPARAHDNGVFYVFSNGVGLDDDEVRTGSAMLIDCYGEIVTESCSVTDDMVVGQFNLNEQSTCSGQRWMRGRRPELYASLCASSGKELDPRSARFNEDPVK